jgi:hypothetical protein
VAAGFDELNSRVGVDSAWSGKSPKRELLENHTESCTSTHAALGAVCFGILLNIIPVLLIVQIRDTPLIMTIGTDR